jgi:hypothetical protein
MVIEPFVYTFAKPIAESWILNIQNNLSYAYRPDAKVVVKLQEPSPSDKFIEIGMYGETASHRFWAAVNTAESGYIRIYDKTGVDGWSLMCHSWFVLNSCDFVHNIYIVTTYNE